MPSRTTIGAAAPLLALPWRVLGALFVSVGTPRRIADHHGLVFDERRDGESLVITFSRR